MNESAKVSILIPCYKQAAYVGAAIASALAQDYPDLEVVVADDASGDGTAEAVAAMSDPRLRYEPAARNLGRVANYRRGLYELARGDWVLNLDGDDFLVDPGFVSAAMSAAQSEDDVVLIFADRYEADDPVDPGAYATADSAIASPERLDGTSYVLSLPRKGLRLHHLCALYRRDAAKAIDFYRADIVSSDYESLYRLVLGKRMIHLPAKVAVWRRHAGNASRAGETEATVGNYRLFSGVRDFAVETLGGAYEERFDVWLERNVAYRFYGNIRSRLAAGDFRGLARIASFIRTAHPRAYRRTLASPRTMMKGGVALATHLARALRDIVCGSGAK